MHISAHDVSTFLVSFTFGYVSTALLMAALTAFLAWWLAALISMCVIVGIAYTDTYARAVDTSAKALVSTTRSATSWLRAKFATPKAAS